MRDIRALVDERDDIQMGAKAATLGDQMSPVMYACPVCKKMYDTVDKAAACRDQPFDDGGLKVGDIVVVPVMWTRWYDEDDPWVAFTIPADMESEDHFDHHDRRVPYYVVTALHSERGREHRCLVTLCSLADGSLRAGWNPANGDGHHALYRIDGGKHCISKNSYWMDRIGEYLEGLEPPTQVVEEAARLARLGISTRNLL
jgi:hypothetical protein